MALSDIKRVSEAEAKADELRAAAREEARATAENAEKRGSAAYDRAIREAEEQARSIAASAERTAADMASKADAEAGKECAALEQECEKRLRKASGLIVERVVKA